MLSRMTNEVRLVAAFGLLAFVVSGCGKPASDSAASAKVTFHVKGMGERLHLL